MEDVTKDGFEGAMSKLEELLDSPRLDFLSFDEEMSGIGVCGMSFGEMNRSGDRACDRYEKMRVVAKKFGIIQLGVTVWHRGGVAHPFNFFVFPSARDISLSPGAVEFLNRHGMSWDKWMREGIPYVDEDGEEALLSPEKSVDEVTLSRERDAEFAATELEKVGRLRVGESIMLSANEKSYVRRYLYQEIEKMDCVGENKGGFRIEARRLTAKEVESAARAAIQQREKKIGGRRIFKAIRDTCRQRNVPLVGHNCWFDLLFLMEHFDRPLPESYGDWKSRCHALFPNVLDTKVMAQRYDKYGSLEALYKEYHSSSETNSVHVEFGRRFDKYTVEDGQESSSYHEAGWDSYITGVLFSHLRAASSEGKLHDNNMLNFMRASHHVHLDSSNPFDDPLSWTPRGHVYHVQGPKSTDALLALFPRGALNQHFFYSPDGQWLVDSSEAQLQKHPARGVTVTPYREFSKRVALADARRSSSKRQTALHPSSLWNWFSALFTRSLLLQDAVAPSRKRPRC